jgi:hypothetical protein
VPRFFLHQVRRKIVHVFAVWIFIGKKDAKLYHAHCRNTAGGAVSSIAEAVGEIKTKP